MAVMPLLLVWWTLLYSIRIFLGSRFFFLCLSRVLHLLPILDWTGCETEMISYKNLLQMWIDKRRSIEMAKPPTWRNWRRRSPSEPSNLIPYIVRVEPPPSSSDDLLSYYQTFVPKTTGDEGSRIIHAYDIIFKGFAAKLSPEEVKAMEKIPGFISARVSGVAHLCSTHSTQNMGLLKDSNYGKGVIMSGWKSKWENGAQIKTEEENRGGEESNSSG
ncbi:Hypothetical predicted protein [Olea europaea subsp. europaea]|uniref:Inhibitor I9 domain-containing protein n=1 Tax=Olea europaea subsp. europaea TaxID=158383 RepID=A0A8S0TVT6_OLEEU|nr:Hypothetical predicted protein [Olea europaea subsp. europaea]